MKKLLLLLLIPACVFGQADPNPNAPASALGRRLIAQPTADGMRSILGAPSNVFNLSGSKVILPAGKVLYGNAAGLTNFPTSSTNYLAATNLVFNVQEFGCSGVATWSDQTNIQRTILRAGTNGGGTVYFPKGDYGLHTNFMFPSLLVETKPCALLILSNNITLQFAPGARLVILASIGSSMNLIGAGHSSWSPGRSITNFTVIGGEIVGDGTAMDLFQIDHCQNVLFRDVFGRDTGADVFDTQFCGRVGIYNCRTIRVANSVSTQDHWIRVADCEFRDNRPDNPAIETFSDSFFGDGIITEGCTNSVMVSGGVAHFTDCTFYTPGTSATTNCVNNANAKFTHCTWNGSEYNLHCGPGSVTALDGKCSMFGAGIVLHGVNQFTVRESYLFSSGNNIVPFGSSNVVVESCSVIGANLYRAEDTGKPTHGTRFINNKMLEGGTIYLADGSTNNTISGNDYSLSFGTIQLEDSKTNFVINNLVPRSTVRVIYPSEGSEFTGNHFHQYNISGVNIHRNNKIGSLTPGGGWASCMNIGNTDEQGRLFQNDKILNLFGPANVFGSLAIVVSNIDLTVQTTLTLYTVPAGRTFYLRDAWYVISESDTTDTDANASILVGGLTGSSVREISGDVGAMGRFEMGDGKLLLGGGLVSFENGAPSVAVAKKAHLWISGVLQ